MNSKLNRMTELVQCSQLPIKCILQVVSYLKVFVLFPEEPSLVAWGGDLSLPQVADGCILIPHFFLQLHNLVQEISLGASVTTGKGRSVSQLLQIRLCFRAFYLVKGIVQYMVVVIGVYLYLYLPPHFLLTTISCSFSLNIRKKRWSSTHPHLQYSPHHCQYLHYAVGISD